MTTAANSTYICGSSSADSLYTADDRVPVCMFFPDLALPKKVIFNPRVDQFELLQIKSFFDIYSPLTTARIGNSTDFRIQIMFNGILSKPIVRKIH